MKRTLFLLLLLLSVSVVHAQDAAKRKINEIRLDSTYVGSEAMNLSRDSAFLEACQSLAITIHSELQIPVTTDRLIPLVQQIHVMRGENHRVFVYLRRADIPSESVPPTVESDPVPEPANEQPLLTELESDSLQQSVSESSQQQSVSDHTQQPVSTAEASTPIVSTSNYNEVLMSLMPREMFNEVKKCVEAYVEQGKLNKCGLYNAKVQEPYEQCYFIIVDRSYKIRAYLTPVQADGSRRNVATGSQDALGNYSGCAALWFR